jgi:hypothetical protein
MKLHDFWRNLAWDQWAYGLFSGAIGGGANAVYAAFGAAVIKPKAFPFGSVESFQLMGWMFLFSAAMSGFLYLKQKPLPDVVSEKKEQSVEVTRTPMKGTGDGGSLKKTVSTRTEEKVEVEPSPPEKP